MPGKTASRSTWPATPVQTASCGHPLDSPWRGFFLLAPRASIGQNGSHDRAHAEDATGHDFIDIDPPAIINQIRLRRVPCGSSGICLDNCFDELRREYGRLDEDVRVYLDYTGGGLYAASQVREHADLLISNVFGNPHSVNPSRWR